MKLQPAQLISLNSQQALLAYATIITTKVSPQPTGSHAAHQVLLATDLVVPLS
jgi:hypothetical protein